MDSTVTLFPVKTALIVKNKYVKKWIKQGRGVFFFPFSMTSLELDIPEASAPR